MTSPPSSHSAPLGKRNSLLPPWLEAPRMRSVLYVVWTTMANLMRLHMTRSKRLLNSLLDQSPYGPPKCWDRSAICRMADILPHMKLASRASRPGLTVDFLRIHCNGLCTAQRFHTESYEQMCRVGCPNEPDSLSHYNECPILYCMFFLSGDRLLCFHGEVIFSMTY